MNIIKKINVIFSQESTEWDDPVAYTCGVWVHTGIFDLQLYARSGCSEVLLGDNTACRFACDRRVTV